MTQSGQQKYEAERGREGLADAPTLAISPVPRDGATLLTVAQVAAVLQVSEAWVRDHSTRKKPRLKCVKVGKLLRYRKEHIEEFIAAWCQ
jgi:predicted DNA-binding transcriptional regulator AlpA